MCNCSCRSAPLPAVWEQPWRCCTVPTAQAKWPWNPARITAWTWCAAVWPTRPTWTPNGTTSSVSGRHGSKTSFYLSAIHRAVRKTLNWIWSNLVSETDREKENLIQIVLLWLGRLSLGPLWLCWFHSFQPPDGEAAFLWQTEGLIWFLRLPCGRLCICPHLLATCRYRFALPPLSLIWSLSPPSPGAFQMPCLILPRGSRDPLISSLSWILSM